MNGRVYDPVIGRFLSADPFVQAPYFSQSYNRYSYVMNNPLGGTDPSGYCSTLSDCYITNPVSNQNWDVDINYSLDQAINNTANYANNMQTTFDPVISYDSVVASTSNVIGNSNDYKLQSSFGNVPLLAEAGNGPATQQAISSVEIMSSTMGVLGVAASMPVLLGGESSLINQNSNKFSYNGSTYKNTFYGNQSSLYSSQIISLAKNQQAALSAAYKIAAPLGNVLTVGGVVTSYAMYEQGCISKERAMFNIGSSGSLFALGVSGYGTLAAAIGVGLYSADTLNQNLLAPAFKGASKRIVEQEHRMRESLINNSEYHYYSW